MKKIPVWKNVVLISSILVVFVIATFAWFYRGNTANTNGFEAEVTDARFIQISGSGDNWSDSVDMEIGVNKGFREISGDGISFFVPDYDDVENPDGGLSKQIITFNRVKGSDYHYEQVLYVRADAVQEIYLSPKSSVSPVNASYIDGAIRVAFFELDENDNEILKFVWAPNSRVEYSAQTNSFTRDGSVEPYYYYQKSTTPVSVENLEELNGDVAMISTEGTDNNGCGYNPKYKFMWSNGNNLPDNAPSLLTIDGSGEDKNFYSRIKVKVWLEGHDRECVSLLSGQKFTLKLQFDAKEENNGE